MAKSKKKENNLDDLVKGAINYDLENGFVLYLSEDGNKINRKPVGGTDCEKAVISSETFLRAVGFNVDTSPLSGLYIKERDYNIIVGIFNIVENIELSYLRRLVEIFEEASNDAKSVSYIANEEHFIRSMIQ